MLRVENLSKTFPGRGWLGKPLRAVHGVSFDLDEGEAIGIVGESGSGKTTVGRLVSVLLAPSAGRVRFDNEEISALDPARFVTHPLRRQIQHVFQDATENLTPHFTAGDAIADPLRRLLGVRDPRASVNELAASVGLPPELLSRYPHQLSGGQRARVGIARALATAPRLLVLDEPTASLDVSVQAGVLRTLHELRARLGLAMVFISHDIEVVRLMCDRALVMREGVVVESGAIGTVLGSPSQDYTRELIRSVPRIPA